MEARTEAAFLQGLVEHTVAVRASAERGDGRRVAAAVRANPDGSFAFDATGQATLTAGGIKFSVGRFETPSLAILRKRILATRRVAELGQVRLWVLDGASVAIDIGALQATAGPSTLFQVASQFNCLESPRPYVTPVNSYFSDPTQGPREPQNAGSPGSL